MNEEMLIVKYNPFAKESLVYISRKGEITQAEVASNLSMFISGLEEIANATNITLIRIDAPNYLIEEVQSKLPNLEVEGI